MTYWFKTTPAQDIKSELKKAFPSIKFSCKYRSFSMWDAVDVEWIDWPTEAEVNKVIQKYRYWHFDWMTDMYEQSNLRRDLNQAKYVTARRNASPEVEAVLYELTSKVFTEHDRNRYYNYESMARHLFSFYPITSNNIEVVDTGATCRCWVEQKYAIVCK